MADRLTLTRAFEGAGVQSADAERIATEINDAIHDNVATKVDVDKLRGELAIAVRDLKIWVGSIAVIIAGLSFGAADAARGRRFVVAVSARYGISLLSSEDECLIW
jgi:hypothetical protein